MFKQLKSAQIFKMALPAALDLETIIESEEAFTRDDINETEFSVLSFAPNPINGRYVTPLETGYAFFIRYQEKIMPAKAIKREVDQVVRDIEEEYSRSVGRKERLAIKDDVMARMVKTAPVGEKITAAFYDYNQKNLYVSSISEKDGKRVCSMLVRVVGQVTTSTVHIDAQRKGLAARLGDHINGKPDAFGAFEIGHSLKLTSLEEGKITFKGETFNCGEDDYHLFEQVVGGALVDEIQLRFGTVQFVLDQKFRLKQIADLAEEEEPVFETAGDEWIHGANLRMTQLNAIVEKLCHLFEYTPVIPEENTNA